MTIRYLQIPGKPKKKTLIVLVGPTAIGKTSLAIKIAQHFDTVILSADSRQFYKELKIGTATPTTEEKSKIPHYFASHLSIHQYYNVARFEKDALRLLHTIFAEKDVAVLTGGSGLYINAVCDGIDDMPDPNEDIRNKIDDWHTNEGIDFLRKKLAQLDPEYFEKVDKSNPNRIKRAIEVCLLTGNTYTSFRCRETKPRDFEIIKIGINRPRELLFRNISTRTDGMIEKGLVEEVESLTPFRHLNALKTVGYREIFDFLDGEIPLERAIENIKTNTRRYAKRQLTWFKRDNEIRWFLPEHTHEILQYLHTKIF